MKSQSIVSRLWRVRADGIRNCRLLLLLVVVVVDFVEALAGRVQFTGCSCCSYCGRVRRVLEVEEHARRETASRTNASKFFLSRINWMDGRTDDFRNLDRNKNNWAKTRWPMEEVESLWN